MNMKRKTGTERQSNLHRFALAGVDILVRVNNFYYWKVTIVDTYNKAIKLDHFLFNCIGPALLKFLLCPVCWSIKRTPSTWPSLKMFLQAVAATLNDLHRIYHLMNRLTRVCHFRTNTFGINIASGHGWTSSLSWLHLCTSL